MEAEVKLRLYSVDSQVNPAVRVIQIDSMFLFLFLFGKPLLLSICLCDALALGTTSMRPYVCIWK